MKPKTKGTHTKKSRKLQLIQNLKHQNPDKNTQSKTSIVGKIRNVCNKIANCSSNVFDFDSYLLSRLKYLFNTNRQIVNVNKYFHRKKDKKQSEQKQGETTSQETGSQKAVEATPDQINLNYIKHTAKMNSMKSFRDISKLDAILDRHHRLVNMDDISEDFVYKLCSYLKNARTVAAQLWHWKVLDCVRKSKVSFHNFFLHTIGAAIKRMTDDEVKSFSKIVKDTSSLRLDEFDRTLIADPAISCSGDALRRYYLQLLHSHKYLIHQFNQALFSWYTLSMFLPPAKI